VVRLDSAALYAAIDAERRARGLTWDQLSETIGVSVATLKRAKAGGRMEVDGVLAMTGWLGRPVEAFTRPMAR
jgi:hypothetical protein